MYQYIIFSQCFPTIYRQFPFKNRDRHTFWNTSRQGCIQRGGRSPPHHAPPISTPFVSIALFVRLISHQPAVLFSQNKSATSNQSAVLFSHSKSAPARVHLTGGNRPGYRGYRPYRPGPISVPAGYQPGVYKIFGFEIKKLKNEEKISKNTS
jgi:hypothetical protein